MSADDAAKLITAIAAATCAILASLGALWAKIHEYHREVNGRMDELLELTRSSSLAEGRLGRSWPQDTERPR